jgi:hydroxymethylpyrimidine/phosphomethylpyrimidine kinase
LVVDALVERDIAPLVPGAGANVAGATPYAERPDEVAAVDGGIARTLSGARPVGGVRFGASDPLAGTLLAVREADADVRFGAAIREGEAVVAALADLEGAVLEVESESEDGDEAWDVAVTSVADAASDSPVAVLDHRHDGGTPPVTLLAAGPDELVARTTALLDAVESGE